MADYIPCGTCGGRREHNPRTGEVYACDICGNGIAADLDRIDAILKESKADDDSRGN